MSPGGTNPGLMTAIRQLTQYQALNADEMARAVGEIMDGAASDAQIAAFLIALRMKGETVDEIEGAALAMRSRMKTIPLSVSPLLDTCGTGGDDLGTFNISTATAFVAAAAGIHVAKHGNRAVSSRSGSADVLRELGVDLEVSEETTRRTISEDRIGFLFAPRYHPAMRFATPIRRELGLRTIFNILGPLTNPAGAPHQLLGVFDDALRLPLAQVLGRLGAERAWVVCGDDGLDEMTLCGTTRIAEWHRGTAVEHRITPEAVGLSRADPASLKGGTAAENAAIVREVLSGERQGAARDVVALNAGAALMICNQAKTLRDGVEDALSILKRGEALKVLNRLVLATHTGSER